MALDTSLLPPGLSNRFGLGWFIPNNRSIAGIIADVTIEETERDEVITTQHPVEQGAPIADHAFKQPEEVVIRAGWSLQDSGDIGADGVYGYLLNWQASFILFELYTGKRRHRNMLITGLWVTTDSHSEYALMVTINCKEIILTKTQTKQAAFSSDTGNQSNPEKTSSPTDLGKQPLSDQTDRLGGGAVGADLVIPGVGG